MLEYTRNTSRCKCCKTVLKPGDIFFSTRERETENSFHRYCPTCMSKVVEVLSTESLREISSYLRLPIKIGRGTSHCSCCGKPLTKGHAFFHSFQNAVFSYNLCFPCLKKKVIETPIHTLPLMEQRIKKGALKATYIVAMDLKVEASPDFYTYSSFKIVKGAILKAYEIPTHGVELLCKVSLPKEDKCRLISITVLAELVAKGKLILLD